MDIDLISANVVDLSPTGVEVIYVLQRHLRRSDRRQRCFKGYVAQSGVITQLTSLEMTRVLSTLAPR